MSGGGTTISLLMFCFMWLIHEGYGLCTCEGTPALTRNSLFKLLCRGLLEVYQRAVMSVRVWTRASPSTIHLKRKWNWYQSSQMSGEEWASSALKDDLFFSSFPKDGMWSCNLKDPLKECRHPHEECHAFQTVYFPPSPNPLSWPHTATHVHFVWLNKELYHNVELGQKTTFVSHSKFNWGRPRG